MKSPRCLSGLLAVAAIVALAGPLAGCERVLRNMYDQPKLKTYAASPLFVNGKASRPPPPGSVARAIGERAADAGGVPAEAAGASAVALNELAGRHSLATLDRLDAATSLPATTDPAARLRRGRERYAIYCAPCHGESGAGDGTVAQRGFPAPPSFALARLRDAPDRRFFDAMTNGYGVMYPYRDRVDAADRWAITAWIRRLQQRGGAPAAATR